MIEPSERAVVDSFVIAHPSNTHGPAIATTHWGKPMNSSRRIPNTGDWAKQPKSARPHTASYSSTASRRRLAVIREETTHGRWAMTGSSSASRLNWTGGLNRRHVAETESLKSSGSIESDPLLSHKLSYKNQLVIILTRIWWWISTQQR